MAKYLFALLICLTAVGVNAERDVYSVTIKNHQFMPSEIVVPTNTLVFLEVKNKDSGPEEFESKDLHREKIIAGGKTARIKIGPLKPGTYNFFGNFNPDTAKGRVIAK